MTNNTTISSQSLAIPIASEQPIAPGAMARRHNESRQSPTEPQRVQPHPPASPMRVELIITQGSNAGSTAKIQAGYYLVGRHKECQIRPKSKSVSRRHCVLLHNEDGFGALDLKSASGTYVNGSRLHPHRWRVLSDGDQLRFGKVAFTVSIKNAENAAADQTPTGTESKAAPTPASWQSVEIAEFLESEDEAEFAERYGIAATSDATLPSTSTSGSNSAITESEHEIDVFDDSEIGLDPKPKQKPPRRKIDHAAYKRKPKRTISLPNFHFNFRSGEPLNWQLVGSLALAALTIAVMAYQIYDFSAGSDIPIREGLD